MKMLTGETSDISIFLQFHFYEEVYYSSVNTKFPSESTEESGYFIGFGESVGDAMTFKVLTKDTQKVIFRSNFRSAVLYPNQRLEDHGGVDKIDKVFIASKHDDGSLPLSELPALPGFLPADLIGSTFLDLPQEDGQRLRMKIVKAIAEHRDESDKHPYKVKFLAECPDGTYDQILTYKEILDHLERNNNNDDNLEEGYMHFRDITAHQGPLLPTYSGYKGSRYNVLVEWEDGDVTYEPLHKMAADDPVTCAVYAKRNGLLDTPGWKQFKRIVKNSEKLRRMI